MAEAKTLVNVLGWIYVVFSALGILVGIGFLVAGPMMMSMMTSMDPSSTGAAGMAGGLFVTIGIVTIVIEGLILWAALQLMKFKNWARILFIVIGVLSLPGIPVGTAIGIFTIWVLLFNEEAKRLFHEGAPVAAAAPAAEAPAGDAGSDEEGKE